MIPCVEVVGRFVGNGVQCHHLLRAHLGMLIDIQLRLPQSNKKVYIDGKTQEWHRDGDFNGWSPGGFVSPYSILFWSNCAQTEVVDARVHPDRQRVPADADIKRFAPYDIVLLRNRIAWHRTPWGYDKEREFVRAWAPSLMAVKGLRVTLQGERDDACLRTSARQNDRALLESDGRDVQGARAGW